MARNQVQIRGLGKLERRLNAIRGEMKASMAIKSGRAGVNLLKDEMKTQVPKRRPELVDHIVGPLVDVEDGVARFHIGPDRDHFYGGIIEVKGDPWMRPSLDAREADIAKTVGKVVKGEILKHTSR